MKRILSIILIAINACLFGQTSLLVTDASNSQSITPGQTFTVMTVPSLTYATLYNVTNTGSGTHTYVAYRYEMISSSTGGASSFCYAGGCYGPPAYISALQTLTVGQSASDISGSFQMMSVDYEEGASSSYSLVKYTIKSVDSPGDSIQFSYKYNSPNAVRELKRSITHFNVWPNPATEHLSIQLNDQSEIDGDVFLLNLLGQKIKSIKVSHASIISLNVSDVPKGIYFVSLRSEEGIFTERITVN